MLHLGNSHLFHSLICGPFCSGSSTSQIQYSSSTAVPVPVPVLQVLQYRYSCSILASMQYTGTSRIPCTTVVSQYNSTVVRYLSTAVLMNTRSIPSISVLPTAAVQLLCSCRYRSTVGSTWYCRYLGSTITCTWYLYQIQLDLATTSKLQWNTVDYCSVLGLDLARILQVQLQSVWPVRQNYHWNADCASFLCEFPK